MTELKSNPSRGRRNPMKTKTCWSSSWPGTEAWLTLCGGNLIYPNQPIWWCRILSLDVVQVQAGNQAQGGPQWLHILLIQVCLSQGQGSRNQKWLISVEDSSSYILFRQLSQSSHCGSPMEAWWQEIGEALWRPIYALETKRCAVYK